MSTQFLPSLTDAHRRSELAAEMVRHPIIAAYAAERRARARERLGAAEHAVKIATAEQRLQCEAELRAAQTEAALAEGLPDPHRRDIAYTAHGTVFVSGCVPSWFSAQVEEQERMMGPASPPIELQLSMGAQDQAMRPPGQVFIGDPEHAANWR